MRRTAGIVACIAFLVFSTDNFILFFRWFNAGGDWTYETDMAMRASAWFLLAIAALLFTFKFRIVKE